MPKIKEMRCPDCNALYNQEACSEAIHSSLNGRRAERKEIIADIREKAETMDVRQGREESAVYRAMLQYADYLEKKP